MSSFLLIIRRTVFCWECICSVVNVLKNCVQLGMYLSCWECFEELCVVGDVLKFFWECFVELYSVGNVLRIMFSWQCFEELFSLGRVLRCNVELGNKMFWRIMFCWECFVRSCSVGNVLLNYVLLKMFCRIMFYVRNIL